jgi:hypothetical protein
MGKEHGIPEWARRERQRDLDWIADNFHVFGPAATAAFRAQGRGAIVVDTTLRPTDAGHPFGFYPQAFLEDQGDEDVNRMVKEYDPAKEMVVVMLKPQHRMSTYRVQTLPRREP